MKFKKLSIKDETRFATKEDYPVICSLLESAELPLEGVKEHLNNFILFFQNDLLVGTVGLEIYGDKALLRSLGLNKDHQGKGYGLFLSQKIIELAKTKEISELYLLTESAQHFFEKLGFEKISRNEVDKQVQTSVEFCSVCPQSTVCMLLKLN